MYGSPVPKSHPLPLPSGQTKSTTTLVVATAEHTSAPAGNSSGPLVSGRLLSRPTTSQVIGVTES